MRRSVRTTRLLAAALSVLAAAACGGPGEAPPTALTGQVFLPRAATVPAGAVLELRILDITAREKRELGAVRLRGPLEPPVAFAVPFDWVEVDPSHSYALRARVVREGREGREEHVLFATHADTAVLTRGHPRRTDLALVATEPRESTP